MKRNEVLIVGMGVVVGAVLAVLLIPTGARATAPVPVLSIEPAPEPIPVDLRVSLPDWSGCTDHAGAPVACKAPAILFVAGGTKRVMIAVLGSDDDQASDAMIQMWPSGRVEFAADYRLQAPAEAFWSSVAHARMGDCGPLAYRALVAHSRAEQDVARSLRDLTAAQTAWQPPRGDLVGQANDLGSRALACLRSVGITE